jgi:macrolide-specific efflux system membrane fusion protein
VLAAFFVFRPKTVVVKPKIGPVIESVYAIGIVTSDYTYNLKPGVNAVIEKFYFMEGQKVKKGEPLMRTDTGVTFYAPFAGIISKRYNEQGEITIPGQPVLTMVDPVHTHVIVTLDQQSAVRVRVKQKCELSFENMRQNKFHGVIDRIYPSNTQFLAWILAPDLPPEVLVGMSADIAIEVAHRDKAILIPADSLRNGMVTVVRNEKKMRLKVRTGAVNKSWIEVLDGQIAPDDGIIAPKT